MTTARPACWCRSTSRTPVLAPASEVVQVYVRSVDAAVPMPDRQLKAFEKVSLDPGESTHRDVALDQRAFCLLGHGAPLLACAVRAPTRSWSDRRHEPSTRRPVCSTVGSDRSRTVVGMTPEEIADLVHLRRARDLMDRDYAQPLDVPAMARAALMSPAHFSRKFRAAYGETPYSYLMTRRIERAKALLRQGMSVTDTCVAVGCTSLGSFSSRFTEIVGETPSQYRARDHRDLEVVPSCVSMVATRPRRTPVTV